MKKQIYFLFFIIFSCATVVSAQQTEIFHSYNSSAKTQSEGGWLWKISGNGLTHPSYLFGTYHGTFNILYGYVDSIPGFHQALDACSQYVGETLLSKGATTLPNLLANTKLHKDTTYHDLLNDNDYYFLDSILRHKINVPLDKMYMKPLFLTILLGNIDGIEKLKKAGYTKNQIDSINSQLMDGTLEKKVKEKGYTTIGLETVSEQFEMMISGNDQERANQLVDSYRNEENSEFTKFTALTDTLSKVYRSQSMKSLIEYEIQIDSFYLNSCTQIQRMGAHQRQVLLKSRNKNWITQIPELIKDKPTFIAVGVRHLPGEYGLIALLRKEGYKIEAFEATQ